MALACPHYHPRRDTVLVVLARGVHRVHERGPFTQVIAVNLGADLNGPP
jgi:hypothetical protein